MRHGNRSVRAIVDSQLRISLLDQIETRAMLAQNKQNLTP